MVKDLSVDLCGIRLQNPVVPASGTFGFGLELADSMVRCVARFRTDVSFV